MYIFKSFFKYKGFILFFFYKEEKYNYWFFIINKMEVNRSYSQKSIFNDILQKYTDLIKKLFDSLEILSQGNKPEPSIQTTLHDIIEIDKCLQVALNGCMLLLLLLL